MACLKGLKACVFDAYGTLFDIHSPTALIADELGGNAQAISELWRVKQLQYTWLRSLMRTHADFWQVTGDALDFALGAHNVESSDLRERLMELYLTLDVYPDATAALESLKEAGLATAILSNGSPTMLDAAVSHAGIAGLLDQVISIEEAGIFKPDPTVYQLALDRTGLDWDEICFVSANAWDVCGAAHFGLQVVHLNRFGQVEERLPGSPKAEIKSLTELESILT